MSKVATSIVLGVISLFPGIIFFGTGMRWSIAGHVYDFLEKYLFTKYLFTFVTLLLLAICCGAVGIVLGIRTVKRNKIGVLGVLLSSLGIVSAALILAFGLYLATFTD